MEIYVNPGNMTFRKALNLEIYVDKTELITAVDRRFEKFRKQYLDSMRKLSGIGSREDWFPKRTISKASGQDDLIDADS